MKKDNVTHIAPVVTHRCCPECGYLESQKSIDLMRFDMPCPRCGKHQISKFQPIRWLAPENYEDK